MTQEAPAPTAATRATRPRKPRFCCEICTMGEDNQYFFYLHLKQHYEAVAESELDAMDVIQFPDGHTAVLDNVDVQLAEDVNPPGEVVIDTTAAAAVAKVRRPRKKSGKPRKPRRPAADKEVDDPLSPDTAAAKKRGRPKKGTSEQTAEPVTCTICCKNFSSKNILNIHQRIHNNERPYLCTTCGTEFRQRGDLVRHVQSLHDSVKAFQCDFCGKEFARKYSLTLHRTIHTGERRFVCHICQKGFRAATYLTSHMRVHTGEKPYSCPHPECDKKFRISSDAKRHVKIHQAKESGVGVFTKATSFTIIPKQEVDGIAIEEGEEELVHVDEGSLAVATITTIG